MSRHKTINLYLHLHQPWRVREYSVFDTAERHDYFAADSGSKQDNRAIFEKVANKSYRPMNSLLEKILNQHSEFKLSLSITGTFMEQAELWAPDVIEQLQRMVREPVSLEKEVPGTDSKKVKDIEENLASRRAFLETAQKAAADFG